MASRSARLASATQCESSSSIRSVTSLVISVEEASAFMVQQERRFHTLSSNGSITSTGLLPQEGSRRWIKIARERKRFRQKVVWQS
eukprot:691404-Prymnesium_polylepis.3